MNRQATEKEMQALKQARDGDKGNGSDREPWTPKPFTASSLIMNPPQPPKWIVPGILPVGLSYLAGRPKVGKSLLAAQIARAVVNEEARLFDLEVRHGAALYIDVENSRWRIYDRFVKGGLRVGKGADRLLFQLEWPAGNRTGLLHLLDQHKPVITVIDIWSKFRAPRYKDQDQYEHESEELRWLNAAANERDMCIMGVGHRTKFEDPTDPFVSFAGSTAVQGGVDTMLAFSKMPSDTGMRQLQLRGRDTGDETLILRVDGKLNCSKVCDGEQFVSSDQAKYLLAMRGGGVWAQAQLAKELGVTQQAVSKMLSALHDKGLVCLTVGGTQLTPDGFRIAEIVAGGRRV